MKIELDLDETEEALLKAAAATEGVSVEEWILYEIRAALHMHYSLGGRQPHQGLGHKRVRAG